MSKERIKAFERLSIISEKAPLIERMKALEKKHGLDFPGLEEKTNHGDEDFEAWDDYIEWKAYNDKVKELDEKLREIDDASDVQVVG